MGQIYYFDVMGDFFFFFGFWYVWENRVECQFDVFVDCQLRYQRVVLENYIMFRVWIFYWFVFEGYGFFGWFFKICYQVDQSGFVCVREFQQDEEFVFLNFKVDVFQNIGFGSVFFEIFVDVFEFEKVYVDYWLEVKVKRDWMVYIMWFRRKLMRLMVRMVIMIFVKELEELFWNLFQINLLSSGFCVSILVVIRIIQFMLRDK